MLRFEGINSFILFIAHSVSLLFLWFLKARSAATRTLWQFESEAKCPYSKVDSGYHASVMIPKVKKRNSALITARRHFLPGSILGLLFK